MTDTTTPTAAPCPDPPDPAKTTTAIFVTAEGMPDAWVNGTDIEVMVTQPGRPVEATIVVPLADASAWAADVYAAVTFAHREHTGDGMTDYELATLPDPGRLIYDRLAEHWQPD